MGTINPNSLPDMAAAQSLELKNDADFLDSNIPDSDQLSLLWGEAGELWNPSGRLPYFWSAGYHGGEIPPEKNVVANVTDFGAKPNDEIDDTQAFQTAIQQTHGGALLIPSGRYLISDELSITHSDLVLRGEPGTVLFIDKSLSDVAQLKEGSSWSYDGGFISVEPENPKRTEVTKLVRQAQRGDYSVEVSDASSLKAGDFIYLSLTDQPGSISLEQELHNNQAWGGHCEWQQPYEVWWPAQIAAIEGNVATFSQPLRINIKTQWHPTIYKAEPLQEVGIENLTIEFSEVPYEGHGKESGRNAIFFGKNVFNAWVRNVTIENADNGINLMRGAKWITVTDVKLVGRNGHHGLRASNAHDNLFENITFKSKWVHEMTLSSGASGNVFADIDSPHSVQLDMHRAGPYENLFADIDAETRIGQHGDICAGPSQGARNTYWNLGHYDPSRDPNWSYVQANHIGNLDTDEMFTPNREWYEVTNNPYPADIHSAQQERQRGLADKIGVFSNLDFGSRDMFTERNPARWAVTDDATNDARYFLATSLYSQDTGELPGEYSLIKDKTFTDVSVSAKVRTPEILENNLSADCVLILGYQDAQNYYMAVFSADGESGIYRVQDGKKSLLKGTSLPALPDRAWHQIAFKRIGNKLYMLLDEVVMAKASDATFFKGQAGIGSLDDAVWFDDIQVTE